MKHVLIKLVKIEGIYYISNTEMHKEIYNRRGDLNFPDMLNNIVKHN